MSYYRIQRHIGYLYRLFIVKTDNPVEITDFPNSGLSHNLDYEVRDSRSSETKQQGHKRCVRSLPC
jgi:hypothetical protein